MPKSNQIIDPVLYRELCEPFATAEAANDALAAFHADLREIREKHRLPDVLVVIGLNVKYREGEEGRVYTTMSCGSPLETELLAAFALGCCGAERRERVNRVVSGKATTDLGPQK